MLNFNKALLQLPFMDINLNTSHVKLQRQVVKAFLTLNHYLNTSHVKLQQKESEACSEKENI